MGVSDKLLQMKNEKAAANLQAGQDFLAANKAKEGVTALESGLQNFPPRSAFRRPPGRNVGPGQVHIAKPDACPYAVCYERKRT